MGCKSCGVIKCSSQKLKDTENFVENAKNIQKHFGKYNYKKVNYKNSHTKVTITCLVHGDFKMTPANHLSGKGCKKCHFENSRTSREYLILKGDEIHKCKYNYDLAQVVDSKTKVEIICPLHGSFWQTPTSHLQGVGCPSCSVTGFKSELPSTFYVLKSSNLTKIGITNRKIKERVAQLKSGNDFEILAEFCFDEGEKARQLKSRFLKLLRDKYKSPTDVFDGYTECFFDVDNTSLLKEIRMCVWEDLCQY